MKNILRFGSLCVLLITGVAVGEIIYSNDFTTRTSSNLVPSGEWESYTYLRDTVLINQYSIGNGQSYNQTLPWAAGVGQDGWAKANILRDYVNNEPGFYVDAEPGSTNCFAYFRTAAEKVGIAVHAIGNEFTNGVVRFDFDFRRPMAWGGTGSAAYGLRLAPMYRKYVDPDWGGQNMSGIDFPVYVGVNWDSGLKDTVMRIGYGNPLGTLSEVTGGNLPCAANTWYHWRVYLDLETKTVKAYLWNRGSQQPDGPAENLDESNPYWTHTATRYLVKDITSRTGGIAGYALASYRAISGTGSNLNFANAPCFDNVFVAWKAPGASEFVSCYENTFDVRRRRAILDRSTSYVYPEATTERYTDLFSAYVANKPRDNVTNTTMICNSEQKNVDPQPAGMDNWRRMYGTAKAVVIDSETDGATMLRISENNHRIVLAQTLGRQFTTGKVRISADVRLPSQWLNAFDERPRVNLSLGNDEHWTKHGAMTTTTIGYGSIAAFGKNGNNFNVDEFHPSCIPPNGGSLDSMADMEHDCAPTNWYRMVLTANLDTKKYDFDLYELGPNSGVSTRPAGNKVYSRSGIGFRNNLDYVSAFAVWNYGGGDTWEKFILWDNFRAWAFAGDEPTDADLVYTNTFGSRFRYLTRTALPVLDCAYLNGLDHWKRVVEGVEVATADDVVVGEGNRFLSMKADRHGDTTRTVTPFGRTIYSGKVRMRFDARPPAYWVNNTMTKRFVVYGGGETFAQGNSNPTYQNSSQFAVGFITRSDFSLGRSAGAKLRAQDDVTFIQRSTAVDVSHWYRFVVECNLTEGRYTCRVYDQGTGHPQMNTPNGTLVETFSDFKCRIGPADGFSAFGIAYDSAMAVDPWDPYDRGRALLDNIEIKKVDGAVFIVR